MRVLLMLLLLLLLAIPPHSAGASSAAGAEQGVMDVRHIRLTDSGPIPLSGQWHFYWERFEQPLLSSELEPVIIRAPAQWGEQDLPIANQGYGTYRLQLRLHEEDIGRTLGLKVPLIASAYDLYIDGEKRASSGTIGTTSATMRPAALPRTVYFTPASERIELTLHVSNFSQRKGGMWDRLMLGTAEGITRQQEQTLLIQAFFAAGLLMVAAYHVVLHTVRRTRSSLFFGIACLALSLRTAFVGEMLITRLFPDFPWELGVKIEYLSTAIGFPFLVLYLYHLYDNFLPRSISYWLACGCMAVSLPIILLPAAVYTEWLVAYSSILLLQTLYMIYGFVRAALQRRRGSFVSLAGGLFFLGTVVNDVMYYTLRFETIDLVMLGMVVFVVMQMHTLSRQYNAAFKQAEGLRNELKGINENLEAIVLQRTAALQRTNDRLAKSEQARKDVMSHVTHEMGNPLTSIIGYLRRLKEGVPADVAYRHVEIAYQKSLRLEHVMDDLRQLAKLEHGQLSFQFKEISPVQLWGELLAVYDWELLDRPFRFHFNSDNDDGGVVRVDIHRLEQVFINFINNAIAHTKREQEIAVTARLFPFAGAFTLSVRDEGVGIPKEEQERIFDSFYRAEKGSDQYEGSGLGLTISKTIVEAHHGKVGVRSRPGHGSTFYIILPYRGETP